MYCWETLLKLDLEPQIRCVGHLLVAAGPQLWRKSFPRHDPDFSFGAYSCVFAHSYDVSWYDDDLVFGLLLWLFASLIQLDRTNCMVPVRLCLKK